MIICRKCNAQLDDNASFCSNCGASIMKGTSTGRKKGFRLPYLLMLAGILVLTVILVLLIPKVFSESSGVSHGVVYLKDGEIKYTSLPEIRTEVIAKNLDGDSTKGPSIYNYIAFSKDGSRMFYPTSGDNNSFTINYRKVNAKEPEGIEVDSDITWYQINNEGTKIWYLKGTEGDLYLSDLSNKEQLDKNVAKFYLNSTGSRLLYITNDGTIYMKNGEKAKVKINDKSSLQFVSENLSTILYMKGDSLYLKSGEQDAAIVDSGVSQVLHAYDTKEIYYLKAHEVKKYLSELVNDDKAQSDAAMKAPAKPSAPNYNDYKPDTYDPYEPDYEDYMDDTGYVDWDSYYDAYDSYSAELEEYKQKWDTAYNEAVNKYKQKDEEYKKKQEEYEAKLKRDSWRDYFTQNTVNVTEYSLYYYGEDKSTLLTDAFHSKLDCNENKPVLVYLENKKTENSRINISEITDTDDVSKLVASAPALSTGVAVAIKEKSLELSQNQGTSFAFNPKGDALYFINNYDEAKLCGDLSCINLEDTALSDPVIEDEAVSSFYLTGENDTLVYYKNITDLSNLSGDLYVDGKVVDTNVFVVSANTLPGTKNIIYAKDYNNVTDTYTLKQYDGEVTQEIGKEVYHHELFDHKVIYLSDDNSSNKTGILWLYDGTGSSRLDEGVSSVMPGLNRAYWSGRQYNNEGYHLTTK